METSLNRFFAVTTTSLYIVSWSGGASSPVAEKLDLCQGKRSRIPVGDKLVGDVAFLIPSCLEMFVVYDEEAPAERRTEPETRGNTSPIIALFLEEERARSCLATTRLRRRDKRWKTETEAVLTAIGPNHPVFILSTEWFLAATTR